MIPMTFHILIQLITTCIISCDGARAKVTTNKLRPKTMFRSFKPNITVNERETNLNTSLSTINEWSSNGKPEFAGIAGVSGHGYVSSAEAYIAIYAPGTVAAGQSSTAFISLDITDDGVLHQIQIGWAVSPAFYNDMDVHFYLYHWDSTGTSCQDYNCNKFQPSNYKSVSPKLGDKLTPSSVGAPEQIFLHLEIYNDGALNWWIKVNGQSLGSWVGLHYASSARFGGEAYTPPGWHTSPPMGSGSMTDGMKSFTAYFQDVKIDGDVPQNVHKVETRCYYVADEGSPKWFDGYGFFFGGTGGHDKADCNY